MSSASDRRDFMITSMVVHKYIGPGGDVVIPSSVTHIGAGAFTGCRLLNSVTIPFSVTSIGDRAFAGCGNLKSVTIPDTVKSIGDSAFHRCIGLTSVTIPESVTNIGREAFAGCSCLIHIGHWSQILAEAVKRRSKLCDSSDLRFLTDDPITAFPANWRRQALLGFAEEEGTDFGSERAKSYLDYAKKNAGKLIETAFENPKLLSFLCEQKLIGAKDIDAYLAKAEKRGDVGKNALLLDYQNKLGAKEVSKARAKKEKAKEDFSDALAERIAARDPSKGIAGMTFVITGKLNAWPAVWKNRDEVKEYLENYGAFLGTSVTKKTDYLVTNDTSSGSEKNKKAKEYGALVINEAEFNEMVGKRFRDAAEISIPAWLEMVPDEAFREYKKLTRVTIPEGIQVIGSRAFNGCKQLNAAAIPGRMKWIGEDAFRGCSNLTQIHIPEGITEISDGAFCGTGLETVVIPKGVTRIGSLAFGCNDRLKSVEIPESVTSIGAQAFDSCGSLTEIMIPDGVKEIGHSAFQACSQLRKVRIPASVKKIGTSAYGYAFLDCPVLTIHAPACSYAERYAKENNIPFVAEE